ncbi:hypothetical protein AMTRI_Chr13g119370 [Amborella trichopoda]
MCMPSVCLFCKYADESIDHLFLQYTFAERIWDWLSGISCWLTRCPKEMNLRTFEGCTKYLSSLVDSIKRSSSMWAFGPIPMLLFPQGSFLP